MKKKLNNGMVVMIGDVVILLMPVMAVTAAVAVWCVRAQRGWVGGWVGGAHHTYSTWRPCTDACIVGVALLV